MKSEEEAGAAPAAADVTTVTEDAAATEEAAEAEYQASERHRDVAQMRVFLASTRTLLCGRELAYQRGGTPSVSEAHADCLMLLSADIESGTLRAAYTALALIATAAALTGRQSPEQLELQQRRELSDIGDLWLDYCRTVARLCCRIEGSFLRLASKFAASADATKLGGCGGDAAEARQLWLLADAMISLEGRLGVTLSPEFESCRSCLHHCISKQNLFSHELSHQSTRTLSDSEMTAFTPAVCTAGKAKAATGASKQSAGSCKVVGFWWNRRVAEASTAAATSATSAGAASRTRRWRRVLFASIGCVALMAGRYLLFGRDNCWDWGLILESRILPNGAPY